MDDYSYEWEPVDVEIDSEVYYNMLAEQSYNDAVRAYLRDKHTASAIYGMIVEV